MRQTHGWGINILVVMVLLGLYFPALASAATESPEKNPMCWSKEACTEQYKAALWCNDKTTSCKDVVNWVAGGGRGECGTLGGCVPPGRAQLSIAFNGKTEVKDLGEYFKLIYSYLVGIAGVIAAVLIVKGGFEYITAGGASDKISAAKKTIGSAVFGLLLVLASYMLLNTVNPDLVHLRLPNVYMVRKIALGADWCKDADSSSDKKFADATSISYKDVVGLPGNWNTEKLKTTCGVDYWIPEGDGKMCKGESCEGKCSGKEPCACVPSSEKAAVNKQKFVCDEVSIGGTINFAGKKNVDDLWLTVLCTDGSVQSIAKSVITKGSLFGDKTPKTRYSFGYIFDKSLVGTVPERGSKSCGGDEKIKGYFFFLEVNDTSGLVGSSDDQWIGGKSLCKAPSCPWYGRDQLNNSHAKGWIKTGLPNYTEGVLFSQAEMKKGITCNLNVEENAFPNIDVSFSGLSDTKVFPCGITSTIPPSP